MYGGGGIDMNKARELILETICLDVSKNNDSLRLDLLVSTLEEHSIAFLQWTINQGKTKVFYPKEDIEKLYKQFNEEENGK